MAYLKNWTDNFFQIFFMGISKKFDFNGVNLPSTGMWRGEVFAISDCLVYYVVIS